VPPRRLGFGEHSDFAAIGDEFLEHFVALGGLQPGEAVLDVGCGSGRMARPLAGYLSGSGSYDGFDVDRDAIGWCRRRYARHANFRFRVADVFSVRRNPGGAHARDYRFPYDDGAFDFAIVVLALTGLLEEEAEHCLAEVARVLRPGGRMLATAFVLNDESRALMATGRSGLEFLDPDEHVAVLSEDVPEEAVAYDERWLRDRLAEHGLMPREPLRGGSWCGRDEHVSFADVFVATR